MRKRICVATLAVGLGAWVVSSCGGGGFTALPPPAKSGVVASFITDAPFCGVLSFRTQISGMELTAKGATTALPVFGVNARSAPSYKVNFQELRDFSTLLDLSAVPIGTYDKIKLTFSGGQIATYDPLLNPPHVNLVANFTTPSAEVSILPPLVVTDGTVSALRIDFDVRRSLAVDQRGQVTGGVTPNLTVSAITATPSQGFGQLDDMTGIVTSVSTTGTGTGFVGGFGFQTLSGTAPLVSANLTDVKQICGPSTVANQPCPPQPLNQLLTGSFVELDGNFDAKGNLVARAVEVEDQEIPELNRVALIGDVTSVTRDATGNVIQFKLYISDEEPNDELRIALDSTVVVNPAAATIYQSSSRSSNFASLPVDATALAPGQRVVVHGVFTPPPAAVPAPTTVAASKVYVKLQSYQGNFSSTVAVQSDDKTGAFWLDTCSPLFQGVRILVITRGPSANDSFQTAFVNVAGLSALRPQPSLLVKGLLFYELQGGTVNGIKVPPGTLVLETKQVHEIQ